MPIFEYECPGNHEGLPAKTKVERITFGSIEKGPPVCIDCGAIMRQVEFSIPAKRNPEHGVQK